MAARLPGDPMITKAQKGRFTMNCPECGAYASEKDLFCGECGRPLQQGQPSDEPLRPEDVKDQPTEVLASPPPPRPGPTPPAPLTEGKKQPSRTLVFGIAGVLAGLVCLCLAGLAAWLLFDDSSTPTPAAATPAVAAVVYQEDFQDPDSGWDVYNYGDTLALYQDGEYRLGVFRADYVTWGNPDPALALRDLEIEVDARAVEGPLDNNLGILIRYQDDNENFYWFQISSDGMFAVDRLAGDEWVALASWQESTAIRQGLDATNRLKVISSGDEFRFYVNDTWLGTVTDADLDSGSIGLAVGTFDEPGVVVHFDNLRVSHPAE